MARTSDQITVDQAQDMAEATALLAQQRFHCILLDWSLPDATGPEALRQLEQAAPGVPVVVITGREDAAAEQQAIRSGAQDYLIKGTFDLRQLQRAVFHAVTRQELLSMRTQVEAAERLAQVGRLASGVAHDINNPASWITLNQAEIEETLDDLAATGPSAEQAQFLANIRALIGENRNGLQRIVTLSRSLQKLTIHDTGAGAFCSPARAAADALGLLLPQSRHVVEIETHVDTSVPNVRGSRQAITRAVLNLLINAVEAVDQQPQRKRAVRLTVASAGPAGVRIQVDDGGPGFRPGLLEAQESSATQHWPRTQGKGLGMSVTRDLVLGSGGRVEAGTSELGGALVRIYLPVHRAESPPPLTPVPRRGPTTPSPWRDRGRVLLVDDEPRVRRVLARMLKTHAVVEVGSGPEALALLDAGETFDCAIFDMSMPGMTGMDLYESVVARQLALADRVVFCTGGATDTRLAQFLHTFPRVVDKPPIADELREMVLRVINQ